ncbi:BamA/TamA family outer membrane protein [Bacteroides sp. 224]|uniref:translocation and assembly module lipoprotein TamL n=1 Tax=Bacteroides sp. 224 TaxID=2302936 RepID=UPI00351ACD2B
MKGITVVLLALLILNSCKVTNSVTKTLPEGQIFYDGQKELIIDNQLKSPIAEMAMEEVEVALAKAPNNSFMKSSTTRIPFPLGIWLYKHYGESKKGLGRFLYKKLGSQPILISTVNPGLRQKSANNILRDYGFFNATVDYQLIPNKKNDKRARIQFHIDMKNPYFLDSIAYRRFSPEMMEIISRSETRSVLRKGNQFNVIDLSNERERLSTIFRNVGFYYFRPDFIGFRADTTRVSGLVDIQVVPKSGLPADVTKRWYIGDISVELYGRNGEVPNDSMKYKDLTIYYHNKLDLRPKVLHQRFRFAPEQRYSQRRTTLTQQKFAELGIFRYTEMQFHPRDTVRTNNILDVKVKSGFDLPYDSELELNLATKSNDYAGPGASYSVTKRNVFKGGETFTVGVKGSYEWQTKTPSGGSTGKVNSWEIGLNAALKFPRILFPRLGKKDYDFPATTTFNANIDQLNRAHFFKMLSFGGDATYTFQPTRVSKHTITPLRLTFSTLQNRTKQFDEIMNNNPALAKSMENQFIPALVYTYTYDDISKRKQKDRNHFWWQSSLTSSGNITSGVYALLGKGFNEEKKLLNSNLAQFLKLTSELRYTWGIDRNQSIATRFLAGGIYAYGGSKYAPYKEQFFIGGANSIRAFTVRGIGPGSYYPKEESKYSYLDQTGDLKFEANMEYRFRIVKDLHGAIFLDAGNVWLLRDREGIDNGKFTLKNLGDNIALGTGAGLRYDLTFLVIRLDLGIGIHAPYDTGKSGYYNIPKFSDGLGFHFAIGYPF